MRDAAGILDLPGFSRFRLTGAGAADWLSRQITGKLPTAGRLGLAYFADDKGRIVTEMSVARHGRGRGAADHRRHRAMPRPRLAASGIWPRA